MGQYLLKASDEQFEEWRAAAGRDRLSLAEWIRRACREAAALEAAVAREDTKFVADERLGQRDLYAMPRPRIEQRSFKPDFKR